MKSLANRLTPEIVKQLLNDIVRDMDTTTEYMESEIERDNNGKIKRTELYQNYKGWCENTGNRWVSVRQFNKILRKSNYKEGKIRGNRYWKKIKYKNNGYMFEEEAPASTNSIFDLDKKY